MYHKNSILERLRHQLVDKHLRICCFVGMNCEARKSETVKNSLSKTTKEWNEVLYTCEVIFLVLEEEEHVFILIILQE